MKYIADWGRTDEEISIILHKNEKYYDIKIETVENILYDINHIAYHSTVISYPCDTVKILEKENPSRSCRVYRSYNDGWNCIYENINCIELL